MQVALRGLWNVLMRPVELSSIRDLKPIRALTGTRFEVESYVSTAKYIGHIMGIAGWQQHQSLSPYLKGQGT